MPAYVIAPWSNFFLVEAAAAATLSGLVIVAISINIARILASPQLPGRAGESLVKLMGVLLLASLALVPEQPIRWYGIEALAVGLPMWGLPFRLQIHSLLRHRDQPRQWILPRFALSQMATLPILVAGVSLLVERGGGLYWLVPGVLFSLIAAVHNTWVLLVEILR